MKRIVAIFLLLGILPYLYADNLIHIPVNRVVTLASNMAEILFAIGAGSKVKGVSAFSDYPKAATKLPIIASSSGMNMERIAMLKPDLAVAWAEGNPAQELNELKQLNIPVYSARVATIPQIATAMLRLGQITGTSLKAQAVASQFMQTYQKLRDRYENQKPVSVFYQMSTQPLMTLNGKTLQSQMIHDCGGVNIFANAYGVAPQVNRAAVLAKQPQVIIISQPKSDRQDLAGFWQQYPEIPAVKNHQIYLIPSDLVDRAGPRVVQGMREICQAIARARKTAVK